MRQLHESLWYLTEALDLSLQALSERSLAGDPDLEVDPPGAQRRGGVVVAGLLVEVAEAVDDRVRLADVRRMNNASRGEETL